MNKISENAHARLISNGYSVKDGMPFDELYLQPVIKITNTVKHTVWVLTSIDADLPDMAFGLCDSGEGRPTLGPVHLKKLLRSNDLEISTTNAASGTLWDCYGEAWRNGQIMD